MLELRRARGIICHTYVFLSYFEVPVLVSSDSSWKFVVRQGIHVGRTPIRYVQTKHMVFVFLLHPIWGRYVFWKRPPNKLSPKYVYFH